MKKFLGSLLIFSLLLTAALPSLAAAAPAGRLMVYAAIPTAQLDLMVDMFGDKYPRIIVDVLSAKEADVMARVQAEAGAPQGDVVLGGGLAAYQAVEGLLASYATPNAKSFVEGYAAQAFTPIQLHVSAMIVNPALVKQAGVQIEGWASLKDERLSGQVVYMDPAASSPDAQQAAFVNSFAQSLDVAAPSAPSFVLNAVTMGQYAVGIISEEKAIERKLAGADLEVVYAAEGVAMGASYAGILAGTKNQEAAQLFMDFITSREYQQAAAEQLHQRSIRTDVNFGLKEIAKTRDLVAANYDQLTLTLIADAAVAGSSR